MTTLIFAEWYKLLRSKVLAIILVGVTAQTVIQVLANYNYTKPILGQFGVFAPAGLSFLLQVWLLAFVGYFVTSEFQNGTMRNMLALGKSRMHVYLSKLVSNFIALAAIYTTIILVATVGFSSVSGFGDMPLDKFWRFFTWSFFMQLLYHFIFAAIFTMFAFVSRSLGMTIFLGLGYLIIMIFFPGVLRNMGISSAIEYFPDYYIYEFGSLSGDPAFVTKGMLISVVYIAITSIIGCITFQKVDVK
jgi:ABC-2 type transport system permease protein